jgi:hypothetical protein
MKMVQSASEVVLCLIRSHRERDRLREAAEALIARSAWRDLAAVYRIGLALGDWRTVERIHDLPRWLPFARLAPADLAAWRLTAAARWFDIELTSEPPLLRVAAADQARLAAVLGPAPSSAWDGALRLAAADGLLPERLALLRRLAAGEEACLPVNWAELAAGADEAALAEGGRVVLRRLQPSRRQPSRTGHVAVALDADGLIKVFKEERPRGEEPYRAGCALESDLHDAARQLPGVVPSFGTSVIDGRRYLRQPVVYGPTLAELLESERRFSTREALSTVRALALTLAGLHGRGIVHADVRPENVKLGDGVTLLDLGDGHRLPAGAETATAPMGDPRYAAPELVREFTVSRAADVFALGVLAWTLLLGRHPFAVQPAPAAADRGAFMEHYAVANLGRPSLPETPELAADERSVLVRALSPEAAARPTMAALAAALPKEDVPVDLSHGYRAPPPTLGMALFPARMAIPHRGHIEFVRRLIETGWHVRISLQRAYTSTADDPYPKWLVLKMVGRSLRALGFGQRHFSFMLTPYFDYQVRHRLHFAMMPDAEKVTVTASGNPGTLDLLPAWPTLDQRAFFGREGEEYAVRSWGRFLRTALLTGDEALFRRFAASGVEEVMPFAELRARYNEQPVSFVEGHVRLALPGYLARPMRCPLYELPEQALATALRGMGHSVHVLDPYERDAVWLLDGRAARLRCGRTQVAGEDLHLCFTID